MPRLRAVTPDGHAREFPIGPARTTIGRGSGCEILIDNPTLSRQHAAIEAQGAAHFVVDLGSKNGVRVDGKAVSRAELKAGSRFKLGQIEFEFLEASRSPGQAGSQSQTSPVQAAAPPQPGPPGPKAEAVGEATDAIPQVGDGGRGVLIGVAAGFGGLALAGGILTLILTSGGRKPVAEENTGGKKVVQRVAAEAPRKAAGEPVKEAEPEVRPAPENRPDPEEPKADELRIRFRDGTARVGKLLKRTKHVVEVGFTENGEWAEETYPIEDVLRIGDETVRPDWDAVFRRKLADAGSSPEKLRALEGWCRKYGFDKGRREVVELLGAKKGDGTNASVAAAPGKARYAGASVDPQELRADGRMDAKGRLVPTAGDLRFIREVHFDLLGRSPTPEEVRASAAESRPELVARLVNSVEHWETWYDEELYYFLLLENFRPATDRMTSMPARLSAGTLTVPDAVTEIVISQYFNHRNPGNDTYVTVIFEQLLGIVVQDQPMLLKVGKQMYDGYEGKIFDRPGASQFDLVAIVTQQKRFFEMLLERYHLRYTGEPIDAAQRDATVARLAADPAQFPAVIREWLLGDGYMARAQRLRRRTDHQFIRSIYTDLLGRRPSYGEFRLFRNALQALADPTPIRSVLAKVMVDSPQTKFDKPADAGAWVREQFRKYLGRDPKEAELKAFVPAVEKGSLRLVIQALIEAEEYQYY